MCVRYGCNPLALKIVATSIQDLFAGDIGAFLAEDVAVFNNIQKLLDQQFNRLSSLEQTIMYWLAINREWTTISELVDDILAIVSKANILKALESLSWRSLIEKQSGRVNWIFSVAFSPDGTLVVSGSEDRTVRVWAVNMGNCLTLKGHQDIVYSVAFSPDGRLIASGSADNTVKLWDVGSGDAIETLRGHKAPVYAVKFSPDGRVLASGGYEQNIRLWDVKTVSVLKTLPAHFVWSVAFSPDGTKLAVGAFNSVVRLWN